VFPKPRARARRSRRPVEGYQLEIFKPAKSGRAAAQRLEFQTGDGSSRTQGRVFIALVRAGFAAAEKVSSTVTLCTDAAGNFSLTAHIGSR
jgi:hypothetical protein